jgi:hypothetical protein
MEKWKTTNRFSTFPRGSRDDSYGLSVLRIKTKKQDRPLRGPPIPFQDHVVLEMPRHTKKHLAATGIDAVQQAQSWSRLVGRF